MSRSNYSSLTLLTLSLFITLAPFAPLQGERYMGMPLEDQLQLHTHADLRRLFSLSHTKASTQLPAPLLVSPELTEVRPQINIITEYMSGRSNSNTAITPLMIRDRAWLTKEFKELFHPVLLAPQKKHIARLTSLFDNIIAQHPESFGFIKTITPLERFDSATRKKISLKLSLFARLLSNRKHIPTQVKKAAGVLIAFFQTHLGVLNKSFWKKYKGLIIGAGSIAAILGIGALYKWHKSKQEKTQPSTQPGRQPLTQPDSSAQSVSQRVQGEQTPGSQVSAPGGTTSQAVTEQPEQTPDTPPTQSLDELNRLTESIFLEDIFSPFRINERDKPELINRINQSMKEHFNLSSDTDLQTLMERIAHINDMLGSLNHSVSYKGDWNTAPGADAPAVSFKHWYGIMHGRFSNGTEIPYRERQEPTVSDIQTFESELETVRRNCPLFAKLFGMHDRDALRMYNRNSTLETFLSWNLSEEDQRLLENLNRDSYVTATYKPVLSFDTLSGKNPEEVSAHIKKTDAEWTTEKRILDSSVTDILMPESSRNNYISRLDRAKEIRYYLEERHKIAATEETLKSIAAYIPAYNARFNKPYGTHLFLDFGSLVEIYKIYIKSGISTDEAVRTELHTKLYREKIKSYDDGDVNREDVTYLMGLTHDIEETDQQIEAIEQLIDACADTSNFDLQRASLFNIKNFLDDGSDADLPLTQRIKQITDVRRLLKDVAGEASRSSLSLQLEKVPGNTVAEKILVLRAAQENQGFTPESFKFFHLTAPGGTDQVTQAVRIKRWADALSRKVVGLSNEPLSPHQVIIDIQIANRPPSHTTNGFLTGEALINEIAFLDYFAQRYPVIFDFSHSPLERREKQPILLSDLTKLSINHFSKTISYKDRCEQIDRLVKAANALYTSIGWMPADIEREFFQKPEPGVYASWISNKKPIDEIIKRIELCTRIVEHYAQNKKIGSNVESRRRMNIFNIYKEFQELHANMIEKTLATTNQTEGLPQEMRSIIAQFAAHE